MPLSMMSMGPRATSEEASVIFTRDVTKMEFVTSKRQILKKFSLRLQTLKLIRIQAFKMALDAVIMLLETMRKHFNTTTQHWR
jgi:hypothetical protein